MEKDQHEKYEYARRRLTQKKRLYFHFVLMLIGSVFLVVANKLLNVRPDLDWYLWAVAIWVFLFVLHFIKVYITDRFMNKDWEREQIERLISLQNNRIEQLQAKIDSESTHQTPL
jgi:hypothetical protein